MENGHNPPGKAEQDGMNPADDGPKVVGFVVDLYTCPHAALRNRGADGVDTNAQLAIG
jgi:hypothetical protein